MRFGVREICNVVFRAKSSVRIGNKIFEAGQPVLYIDSAKTSTLEGAATTVYATGGRGNTNLIAWEGEKTLTYTVEDALLSPISFAMLSGAGLIKGTNDAEFVHIHTTTNTTVGANGKIDLSLALGSEEKICSTAPVYVIKAEPDGSITGDTYAGNVDANGKGITLTDTSVPSGTTVIVDYYILKKSTVVDELQIDAENFAGYYYVEADTLFRRQSDGKDLPANITLPNVKIQSNFTFTMASTGDPSTFTFTMDALPGYTYFDNTKKVLCVIQVIDDTTASDAKMKSVMDHEEDEKIGESDSDRVTSKRTAYTFTVTGPTGDNTPDPNSITFVNTTDSDDFTIGLITYDGVNYHTTASLVEGKIQNAYADEMTGSAITAGTTTTISLTAG